MYLTRFRPLIFILLVPACATQGVQTANGNRPEKSSPSVERCLPSEGKYPEEIYGETRSDNRQFEADYLSQILISDRIDKACPYRYVAWASLPPAKMLRDIYPQDSKQRVHAMLDCDLRSDGKLDGCKVAEVSPPDPRFNAGLLTLASKLRVAEPFVRAYQPGSWGFTLTIMLTNRNAIENKVPPCVSSRCVRHIHAPPPPPPRPAAPEVPRSN